MNLYAPAIFAACLALAYVAARRAMREYQAGEPWRATGAAAVLLAMAGVLALVP